MTDGALRLRSLSVGYGRGRRAQLVLSELNAELGRGAFACLLGPNGVGKSTLLRTVAAMQPSLGGVVEIGGDDVTGIPRDELARRLAVVLTERTALRNLTAYDVACLGRHPYTGHFGRLTLRDHSVVRWAIEATGSEHLAAREVAELSDGERQRIMIARALAQEPTLLLLDEPTAFLDLPSRVALTGLLRDLARETDTAVLMSTHDLDLALRTSDLLWLVDPGGRLSIGAPEELALRGDIAATFQNDAVEFDGESGTFHPRRESVATLVLRGSGQPAVWTRRALERAGFDVALEPSSIEEGHGVVTVEDGDDGLLWVYRDSEGAAAEFARLTDLVERLLS